MRKISLIKIDGLLYVKNLGCRTNMFGEPLYFKNHYLGSSSLTIAHDIFHHLDYRCIGTLEDELKALGGFVYIHESDPKKDIWKGIAEDLIHLFKYYKDNLDAVKIEGKKRYDKYLLSYIESMVMIDKELFRTEKTEKLGKFLKLSHLLVYDGYMASAKRYKNQSYKALDNFYAVLKVLGNIMDGLGVIGDYSEIGISYGNGRCSVVGDYRYFF